MIQSSSHKCHIIALANEPRMLRELLRRALEAVPRFIIIEHSGATEPPSNLLKEVQLDWLLVTWNENTGFPRPLYSALKRYPTLSLLALAADGSHAEIRLKSAQGRILRFSFE